MFWDAPPPRGWLMVWLLGGAFWLPLEPGRVSAEDGRTARAAAGSQTPASPRFSTRALRASFGDQADDSEIQRSGRGGADGSSDPLLRQHQALRARVERILAFYQRRLLDTRDNNCWELIHAVVAFGVHSQVRRGGPAGPAVNSISWLCSGAACNGQSLIYLDRGRLAAAKGPKVQGHHGQFLAILAQSKVMVDYPILVGGRRFSVADLIETEKLTCDSGMELTFKLIAFSHYLDSEATWRNARGEPWSISRLIREEIQSPINGAPCGGTHRLMGLSYAVRERQRQREPIDGEFLRAQTYVADFHRYTFGLQNRDGSFSTEWFKRRAAKDDVERRLQTSGHILEWLAYSVPDETLNDPRFIKAVAYLSGILETGSARKWSVGPLGHGLHALALYEERMQRLEQEPVVEANLASRESHRRDASADAEEDAAAAEAEPERSDDKAIDAKAESDAEPAADEQPESEPVLIPAAAPRRAAAASSSEPDRETARPVNSLRN